MVAETATIRVPRETRDLLAKVAEDRGTSVAKLIIEFASREHLHQIYADERRAWAADLANPEFLAELDLWDSADLDDID